MLYKGKLKGAWSPETVISRVSSMNCLKKLRFSSCPRTKVRCQGPPAVAKAQPWESSNNVCVYWPYLIPQCISVILLPLHLVPLTHKNRQRCKMIHDMRPIVCKE